MQCKDVEIFVEQEGLAPLSEAVNSHLSGCRDCRNTGFLGRNAIFEWMDTDNEIRQLILKGTSTDVIRDAARRAGMRTLADDGWRLVRLGITTVEEVLSVTTAKEVARTTKTAENSAPSEQNPASLALGKRE